MISINLLPPSERQTKWPLQTIVVSILGILVLFYFLAYGYNFYIISSLEEKIQETRQQYTLLRPTQDKMQLANTKQQMLNVKNDLLVKLTKERKSWYAIVSRFGIITPPQIWLTELGASDKNVILIKGNALTYPDLANFMQQLEGDEFFAEPVLIKAEKDAKFATTRFEMTVKLKGM